MKSSIVKSSSNMDEIVVVINVAGIELEGSLRYTPSLWFCWVEDVIHCKLSSWVGNHSSEILVIILSPLLPSYCYQFLLSIPTDSSHTTCNKSINWLPTKHSLIIIEVCLYLKDDFRMRPFIPSAKHTSLRRNDVSTNFNAFSSP